MERYGGFETLYDAIDEGGMETVLCNLSYDLNDKYTYEEIIELIEKIMKEIDRTKMERLIKQLEWFNNFADYLEANNINMYNESCDYADNKERYEIF